MMRPFFTWLIIFVSTALALWQLVTPDASFPALALGLLLWLIGGIAGLRWGADSVAPLIKEMSQLNKYLAEQNEQLAKMDHLLMKKVLAQEKEHSSQSARTDA